MRVLDIGTWDGFWSFEMERRGAAEVVALDLDDERDLDWPPRRRPATFPERMRGDGFRLAKEVLGSGVQRVVCNLYDADPTIRLSQYLMLGFGGIRALQALGIDPGVIHLNEGHAALVTESTALGFHSLSNIRAGSVIRVARVRFVAGERPTVWTWKPTRTSATKSRLAGLSTWPWSRRSEV